MLTLKEFIALLLAGSAVIAIALLGAEYLDSVRPAGTLPEAPHYAAPSSVRECVVRHPTGELNYTRCAAYKGQLQGSQVYYYQCADGIDGFAHITDPLCKLHGEQQQEEITP